MSKNFARNSTKSRTSGANLLKQPSVAFGAIFVTLFVTLAAFTSSRTMRLSSIGGPFQLTAHTGQALTDKDLLGRPFLVFFGYTHCFDICHTTLFEMSEIVRTLGPQAKISAIFVTVDPERDTPEALKDYLANFDPRIVGLSGDRAAIDLMLRAYHIYAKRSRGDGEDYSVDHTIVVYLMDKDGRFVSTFNVARKPADAARELESYL